MLAVEIATLGKSSFQRVKYCYLYKGKEILQYEWSYNTIYSVNVSPYESENWLGISLRGRL